MGLISGLLSSTGPARLLIGAVASTSQIAMAPVIARWFAKHARVCALLRIPAIDRNRDCHEDADDQHDHHELDQRET